MRYLLFVVFISTSCFNSISQNILINEFCSSNSTIIADENGDYEDWIELYNPTTDSINLEGWGLSDNESKPYKWIFPNITIAPNDYLLLFASGKDLKLEPRDGVYYEKYEDIQGGRIEDLINDNSYPEAPNKSLIFTDFFEAPHNQGYYFGHRLHGVFVAPQTGYYTFWLASDDYGVLYLSEDETSENLNIIASVEGWTKNREWNKYSSQQSEEIYLEEGKEYYLLALAKQAIGGDNLAVGWQLPNNKLERPIPASHFKVYNSKELHTNFSLAIEGEPIILTDKYGNTVDYISETSLLGNISYGLRRDGNGYGYFTNPTPGKENYETSFSEISFDEVKFSHKGGFYNEEFLLELSCDNPNAQIYYTLDGSEPSPYNLGGKEYSCALGYPLGVQETAETKTYLYTEPIEIKDISNEPYQFAKVTTHFANKTHLPIDNFFKGNVVRAVIVDEDILYSNVIGHSYFITTEGTDRYNLPVASIITDPVGLFDYEKGIYVPGKIVDDWFVGNPSSNFDYKVSANYNQKGSHWERPGHLNYYYDNNQKQYNKNIGIRIHGNYTRIVYRKSFRINAKNKYDLKEKFTIPLFNDLKNYKGDSIKSFDRILLRNSGNDYKDILYRDALIQSLLKELPFSIQDYQPVVHFVNGEYWGIMNLRERYDKYYLASHFNVDTEDVAILKHNATIDYGNQEDQDYFKSILLYVQNNDITLSENLDFVNSKINLESMFQYYAAQIYSVNIDWPRNNHRYWRYRKGVYSKDSPLGIDGRWSWMMYDTDHGFDFKNNNSYALDDFERIFTTEIVERTTLLFKKILENKSAQNRFINIVSDQINSCFKPDYVHSKVDEFNARLASSRAEHYNRWRSGNDEGETIKIFATERPAYMRDHTRDYFNLGDDIDIVVSKKGDGKVQLNSLLIDENLPGISDIDAPYPWSGVYYADVPVQLKAVDTKTAIFSHWEGDIPVELKNNREIEIAFSENSSVTAVFTEYPPEQLQLVKWFEII